MYYCEINLICSLTKTSYFEINLIHWLTKAIKIRVVDMKTNGDVCKPTERYYPLVCKPGAAFGFGFQTNAADTYWFSNQRSFPKNGNISTIYFSTL